MTNVDREGLSAPDDEVAKPSGSAQQEDLKSVTREPVDSKEYNDFVASVELAGINVLGVAGERRLAGEAPQTRFEWAAAYQIEDFIVHYRFDASGHLNDKDGKDYGEVSAVVVVSLTLTQPPPGAACVERFGNQSAAMMAYPYLREVLASTALRLGFGGVLLPMMTQQPLAAEANID